MTTILVANRGEIAIRVFRTAKRLGMRTVAVHTEHDERAPHTAAADVEVGIASYLDIDAILRAAEQTGAELVHPGYGFLAEDDAFAQACEDAGLLFVGPPARVLRAVGDKASARALAESAGVPVFAGYAGADQSDDALTRAAQQIGFPVLVKPAAGGGGKGMSVVRDPSQLDDAVDAARRIARGAFGDDRLILERFIDGPRHVEVQVIADAYGNVMHLGERDCSLQRRHQKILEESPAPNLDETLRTRLHDAAAAFASAASYVGAGTCEFLVANDRSFGLIEMNARLQVEHAVTEMVTGLDLVELQLAVAIGDELPKIDASPDGHAMEVRVYAEDPADGFVPQAGRIEHVRWPTSARVDAGVEEGTDVSTHYDPMLAKLIVRGADREAAIARMTEALRATEILGVRTNLWFLHAVVRHDVVRNGTITTDWLDERPADWSLPSQIDVATLVAAAAEVDRVTKTGSRDPWTSMRSWRGSGRTSARVVLHDAHGEYAVAVDDELPTVRADDCHGWRLGDERAAAAHGDGRWYVWAGGVQHEFVVGPRPRRATAGPARLESPLPGQVVAVRVTAGQSVEAGQELVVVEAMKMEHAIKAPAAGVVHAVLCAAGDQVDRGQALVDFEPASP